MPSLNIPPDLDAKKIQSQLTEADIWQISSYALLDSTNIHMRQLANQGAPEYSVVIADSQSGGLGRLGRAWSSPGGQGLYLTLLLRPAIAPDQAQLYALVAAVATAEALGELGYAVGIKWPNDILSASGKKLCGIKCELRSSASQVEWLLMGIGINVHTPSFSEELRDKASSLDLSYPTQQISRDTLAAKLLDKVYLNYQLLQREGFAPLRAKWLAQAVSIGKMVEVRGMSGNNRGIARDIDEEGYLLLEQDGACIKITIGDMIIDS